MNKNSHLVNLFHGLIYLCTCLRTLIYVHEYLAVSCIVFTVHVHKFQAKFENIILLQEFHSIRYARIRIT